MQCSLLFVFLEIQVAVKLSINLLFQICSKFFPSLFYLWVLWPFFQTHFSDFQIISLNSTLTLSLHFSLSEIALYNWFCFESTLLIQEPPVLPLNLWKNCLFFTSFISFLKCYARSKSCHFNSCVIISSSFINLKAESNFIRKEICDEIEGFGDKSCFLRPSPHFLNTYLIHCRQREKTAFCC